LVEFDFTYGRLVLSLLLSFINTGGSGMGWGGGGRGNIHFASVWVLCVTVICRKTVEQVIHPWLIPGGFISLQEKEKKEEQLLRL
jgi:hypothetical protein